MVVGRLVFLWLSVSALIVCSTNGSSGEVSQFVAAVYEHAFIVAKNRTAIFSRNDALTIIMRNMDIYEAQMKIANQQNTSIIIFPEYGLTGFSYPRESFRPFLEDIPDPVKVDWNACEDPQTNMSTPALYRLSCLAKTYKLYLVVNMGDIKLCNKTTDKHCPNDGRYQYNTNVAFDDKGRLVARYHKENLFLSELKFLNRPLTPEYTTFDTPFGKVGTFICFDALFREPAVPLVKKYKIDHVVFPTAWFDVLPLFSAIGFHSSWARGLEVNFLGANSHVPQLRNTGSGIYTPDGAKKYYRSYSSSGSLLIAALQSKPKKTPMLEHPTNRLKITNDVAASEDIFYSDLFGDLFLFKQLSKAEDNLNLCYNGSSVCCSLEYKMEAKKPDEMYVIGVFDGLHTVEGQYYLQICTLIKCVSLHRSTCGQRVYNASTIFESFTLSSQLNTPFVYPQVVGDGVTLLQDEWDHNMPVNELHTKQRLSKGLLTAALFGRVYKWDNGTKSVGNNGSSLYVSKHHVIVNLLVLKAFLHVF